MFNRELIAWINLTTKYKGLKDKIKEKKFGNDLCIKYFGATKEVTQWTTRLGEGIAEKLLSIHYKVKRQVEKKYENSYIRVDLEIDPCIIEVKTRNYTTSGTAGEKIFFTPYKYFYCAQEKPIVILLLAYQEKEAVEKMMLFDKTNKRTQNFMKIFAHIGKGVYFMKGSDLFKHRKENGWIKKWLQTQHDRYF